MPTVTRPSSQSRAHRKPALVAIVISCSLVSRSSARYRAKTRSPFPHISAMEPSAFR